MRVRSPHARAEVDVDVNPTIVMPGGQASEGQTVLVRCPLCGRRNLESETFDCMGPCGRQNLCLRHLDKECNVCQQCAAQAERSTRRQFEELTFALRTEARAQLEAGDLTQALLACVRALHLAPEDVEALRLLKECEDHLRYLVAEAERWQRAAEEAQARVAEFEEGGRAAKEAHRQAEESARQGPLWQQIGIEMVTIPAGEFLYGEDNQKVYLSEYCLARTPVTNLQYRGFVEATGHRKPYHWSGGQIPLRKGDHPVVHVSWRDAEAFCQWAGCRLPTELEWEKGARGADGSKYPWGNGWQGGHCNTIETGIGDTTSVTRYPDSASPYGLLDMAGNVYEWCDDWYDGDRKGKMLRGGCWGESLVEARCVFRGWYPLVYHREIIGFRCCVGPASSV